MRNWINKRTVAILASTLLLAGAAGAQAQDKILSLSECIVRTLQNNLGVAVDVLGPQVAGASLDRAQEKFFPTVNLGWNNRETNSASYSWLDAAGTSQTKSYDYSAQISEALPFGGTLSATLQNSKTDTTQSFQTINPRYGSTLRFTFSQPLLRNFGYDLSRREILVARYSLNISETQLEQNLISALYSVEEAYWNLVYSIENLKVRQQSLDLAKDLLEKNKRSVEVGRMAPMDVLSAQAEVATREADILQAEAQVRNSEDRVKVLINLSAEEEKQFTAIVPADAPSFEAKTINLDDALAIAMQNRPDLRISRIGLQNQELSVSYAKNQLLPGLNLSATYSSPGVSGDQIIYEGNPIFGIIKDRVPGGISNAIQDAFNFKYKNWSVGLTMDIPLGNILSRANYVQAKLNMEQAVLSLKDQEQQAFLEIKTALRAVETNYKRTQAYRLARELAEQKLAAEEEKFKVGQSTNYVVLTYQRDLATARSTELNAIITLNISQAALDRALGVSLRNRNIRLTDYLSRD
ncbi:MAG: TolC family protein [Candidatus Aminicenantes bacterium]|nr:TolC family protein [Candidatus Aminicenantes bacterium]